MSLLPTPNQFSYTDNLNSHLFSFHVLTTVICIAGPVYQPTIKPNEMFYAVSAFLYSFKTLNVISENGTFSPAELKVKAKQYCSTVKISQGLLQSVMSQSFAYLSPKMKKIYSTRSLKLASLVSLNASKFWKTTREMLSHYFMVMTSLFIDHDGPCDVMSLWWRHYTLCCRISRRCWTRRRDLRRWRSSCLTTVWWGCTRTCSSPRDTGSPSTPDSLSPGKPSEGNL